MTNLFFRKVIDPGVDKDASVEGSAYQIIAANIGDSRCVAIQAIHQDQHLKPHTSQVNKSKDDVATISHSNKADNTVHSLDSSEDSQRLEGTPVKDPPKICRDSISSQPESSDTLPLSTLLPKFSSPIRSLKGHGDAPHVYVSVKIRALSEDHNLHCTRERHRIIERLTLQPMHLPLDLSLTSLQRAADDKRNKTQIADQSKLIDKTVVATTSDAMEEIEKIHSGANMFKKSSMKSSKINLQGHLNECPEDTSTNGMIESAHASGHAKTLILDANGYLFTLRYDTLPFSAFSVFLRKLDRSERKIAGLTKYLSEGKHLQQPQHSARSHIQTSPPQAPTTAPTSATFTSAADILTPAFVAAPQSSPEQTQRKTRNISRDGGTEASRSSELVHQHSFIASRTSTDGSSVGPLAFFSRYNRSILMTRSIGDFYGPRSCIAMPDLTSITVPADKHMRFVIASDGLWDVISTENIRRLGLYSAYANAEDFAVMLAHKARSRRERNNLRLDDITVVVIDVNPRLARFIKMKESEVDHFYPSVTYTDLLVKKKTPQASQPQLSSSLESDKSLPVSLNSSMHDTSHHSATSSTGGGGSSSPDQPPASTWTSISSSSSSTSPYWQRNDLVFMETKPLPDKIAMGGKCTLQ